MKKYTLWFLLACPLFTYSQGPCSSTAHHQFDFWLGEWEVFHSQTDTLVGHNTISKSLNGCVVEEHWRGVGGFEGKSLNTYQSADQRWEQTWVDVGGNTFHFSGKLRDRNMAFKGVGTVGGKTYDFEMTFFPKEDGSVRQFWQAREKGAEEWAVWFDGTYRRKTD